MSNGIRRRQGYFSGPVIEERAARLKELLSVIEECSWCGAFYKPYVIRSGKKGSGAARTCYCTEACAYLGDQERKKINYRYRRGNHNEN